VDSISLKGLMLNYLLIKEDSSIYWRKIKLDRDKGLIVQEKSEEMTFNLQPIEI
jgi:hypothetical protein